MRRLHPSWRQLQAFRAGADAITDPEERCRKFWTLLGPLYVFDPRDAARANWYRCDLPNERRLWEYLSRFVFPSMQALALDASALSTVARAGARDSWAPAIAARRMVGQSTGPRSSLTRA